MNESPVVNPTDFELAQLAAAIGRSEPQTEPAALVRKAAALYDAAASYAQAKAEALCIVEDVLSPLEQKEQRKASEAWKDELLAYHGDKGYLADTLAAKKFPRDVVLRELFRATNETTDSREEKLAALLDVHPKGVESSPWELEAKYRQEMGAPKSKATWTDRAKREVAPRGDSPHFDGWLCRWLVEVRIEQLGLIRARAARARARAARARAPKRKPKRRR